MSGQIRVNDLVQVVHVCCDRSWMSHIFVVTEIRHTNRLGWPRCATCGKIVAEAHAMGLAKFGIPISWLRRLDPPSHPETAGQPRELTA